MLPIQEFSGFASKAIQNENEVKPEEKTNVITAQGIAVAKDSSA